LINLLCDEETAYITQGTQWGCLIILLWNDFSTRCWLHHI